MAMAAAIRCFMSTYALSRERSIMPIVYARAQPPPRARAGSSTPRRARRRASAGLDRGQAEPGTGAVGGAVDLLVACQHARELAGGDPEFRGGFRQLPAR